MITCQDRFDERALHRWEAEGGCTRVMQEQPRDEPPGDRRLFAASPVRKPAAEASALDHGLRHRSKGDGRSLRHGKVLVAIADAA
jgi:hypothetical protein